MESESKPMETVTEARGGLVEEENWKNLAEELKQKLVNCEEQIKTAMNKWSKWLNKEIKWMKTEQRFKLIEELLQQENVRLNETYLELLKGKQCEEDETKLKRTEEENQARWTALTQEHEQTVSALKQEQEDHRATKLYWLDRLRRMESESKPTETVTEARGGLVEEENWKNLTEKLKQKLVNYEEQLKTAQDKWSKWFHKEIKWMKTEERAKLIEELLQQENVRLNERYLELLKEKQSEVDDTKLKRTEEENQARWTALTQEHERTVSALKQEQEDHRATKLYWQDRLRQMESESRTMETVTEARGGLVEEENWKNLSEELKQKLVNCEEQLKTAQAELQQEVHLRNVFQEAYEKRERIVVKRQESWEQEKKQLQKKETDLQQENVGLNDKYLELLEKSWLSEVYETKLKRTEEENQAREGLVEEEYWKNVAEKLKQKLVNYEEQLKTAQDQLSEWFQKDRDKTEKEERFKNNEELLKTQTELQRESHLRHVFQETCEKRERTFRKRQKTWKKEKKQPKKKETDLQQENVSLKLELLKEKQSEDDTKLNRTEEENQARWTELTQKYEEVLSALKQEQSKCRATKLYWQERVRQMESESRPTETVTEAQGGLVEPQNEVSKERDNPGPETNDKKKKKVRWWRFWRRV